MKVDDEEISGLLELAEVVVSQKPPASEVVALQADDKKTRKMDAEQFKALLREDRAAGAKRVEKTVEKKLEPPPPAAPRKAATTAELMAQVDDAFADFGPDIEPADAPAPDVAPPLAVARAAAPVVAPDAPASDAIPVEAPQLDSKPIKKQALVVADHRYDTRFASANAPITKPPLNRERAPKLVEPAPVAPVSIDAAPASSQMTLVLVSVLAVAIIVAIAFVLLN